MNICDDITRAVGLSPLVRLKNLSQESGVELLAKVESFNPAIVQTTEEDARAAFDPSFIAIYARSREKIESDSPLIVDGKAKEALGSLGISGRLPTGTDIDISLSARRTWS